MIKNLRVDHRLLHGQVAFCWTSALGADCILIACDDVMKDDIRKMSIKMAKPQELNWLLKQLMTVLKQLIVV